MKRSQRPKLSLRPETIRTLAQAEVRQARGGHPDTSADDTACTGGGSSGGPACAAE